MSSVRTATGRALYALRSGALVRIDAGTPTPVANQQSLTALRVDGGGFVTGVSVGQETYIRTDVGGCYRWDAAASQWVQLLTGTGVPKAVRTGYDVEALAQAPSNASVVYVSIGTGTNGRILRSTDKGVTWQGTTQTFDIQGNAADRYSTERLAVHPTTSTTVLFGGRGTQGLLRSTDGGATFAAFPTQPPAAVGSSGITCVAYDPTDGTRIYAGVSGVGICLWNGTSWSTVHSFTAGYPLEMVVTPTGTLWASFVATAPPWTGGLIRRTKAGVLTNIDAGSQTLYRHWRGIAIDPTNEARVVIVSSDLNAVNGATQQMLRTTNATAATPTWVDMTPALDDGVAGSVWVLDFPDQYTGQARFTQDGGAMWVSTGWGMFLTADLADTQSTLVFTSRGIEERVAQTVLKPAGHPLLTIGWDIGIFRHPVGELATRPHPYRAFGSGWALAQCPNNSNFIVAVLDPHPGASASPQAKQSGYSTDGGATWTRFASLAAGTHPTDLQFGHIAVSATNVDNIAWAPGNGPTNRMYYTTNRGSSWTASSVPADYEIAEEHFQRRAVLVAHPTTAGTFYAMAYRTSDGKDSLLRSTDSGATWALVTTTGLENFNFRYGSKLKASATHLFAIPGHTDEGNRAFYRAALTDVTTWTKITSLYNAHDIGIGAPLAGQTNPTLYSYGRLTLAGNDGLHYSTDLGATWTFIEEYVNNLYDFVTYIAGDPEAAGKFWVGLIGNGFVEGTLSTALLPAPGVPTIGTAVAGNGSATVAFTAGSPAGSSYTATSTPGGVTGGGSTSPITVSGLTNGTAYTFKVKATTSGGTSLESAASNSVTPAAPSGGNVTTYNFEDGTLQGWDGLNSTGATASTTTPITGTRTLRSTAAAAGNHFLRRVGVPVPAGSTSVAVTLKYRQSAARDVLVFADVVPGYSYREVDNSFTVAANTIHTRTATLALPTGTTSLDFYVRQTSALAGDVLEGDDISFTWT